MPSGAVSVKRSSARLPVRLMLTCAGRADAWVIEHIQAAAGRAQCADDERRAVRVGVRRAQRCPVGLDDLDCAGVGVQQVALGRPAGRECWKLPCLA